MTLLAFRRQSSSCGVNVLPVLRVLFGTHTERSCLAAWLSAVSICLHFFIPSNVGSGKMRR